MSLKHKNVNIITAHPNLVTFGIGLSITFVVGCDWNDRSQPNICSLWMHS